MQNSSTSDETIRLNLQAIANRAQSLGLSMPLILLLELHKPLRGIFHALALCGEPLWPYLLGSQIGKALPQILGDSENIEKLIMLLEQKSVTQEKP